MLRAVLALALPVAPLGLHAQDEQPQPEPKAEQEEQIRMPSLSIEQALNLSMRPSSMVRADPRKHC